MTPTIRIFTQALLTPDLSFATLGDARALLDENGLPRLHRTTRFAEAEIEWHGRRYLLSLPLTPSALFRIEHTAAALRKIDCPALTEYRILPHEMRWQDASMNLQISDLVLQTLPSGGGFSEALHTEYGGTLLAALDALETELKRAGFVHRNLKPANLIWSGGRFYPLRYHDAVIGTTEASDAADFEAVRQLVRAATSCTELHEARVEYTPTPRISGHRWAGNPFEGLICVEDETGFGFVDLDNRPVIPSRFRWAGDFHEGRAEVQTDEGMGLIDRKGRFVVPAIYEIVEYDPATSIVSVRQNGLWARFDYTGRRLTEFGTDYAPFEQSDDRPKPDKGLSHL